MPIHGAVSKTKLISGTHCLSFGVRKINIYDNIFLNSNYFISDFTNILKDLYGNPINEPKIFTFQFLIKPLNSNLDKLIKQFNSWRPLFLGPLSNSHALKGKRPMLNDKAVIKFLEKT